MVNLLLPYDRVLYTPLVRRVIAREQKGGLKEQLYNVDESKVRYWFYIKKANLKR